MPPPRFVRRSSTSALRNVSIFSGKLAIGSATRGVTAGTGETKGAGDALVPATDGDALGEAVVIDGCGRVCFATHHCHKTRPITQRATTIHAVRSIKLRAAATHKPKIRWRCGFEVHPEEEPDRARNRPMVDSAPDVSIPTNRRAESHASRLLPKNIANKSAQIGNRNLARRAVKAAATPFADKDKCKRGKV